MPQAFLHKGDVIKQNIGPDNPTCEVQLKNIRGVDERNNAKGDRNDVHRCSSDVIVV